MILRKEVKDINKNLVSVDNEYFSFSDIGRDVNLIPTMTSNTAPSGVASSSGDNSGTYLPWRAFNRTNINNSDCWLSSSPICWLQYQFSGDSKANMYSITARNDAATINSAPKKWVFEGSNNGVDYISLHMINNETSWLVNETRSFQFDNSENYKYYRISIKENNGNTAFTGIANLRLYSLIYYKHILEDLSVNSFVNHGMDEGYSFNLELQIDHLSYSNATSTTLGNGKVFKQSINTLETPIKNVSIT